MVGCVGQAAGGRRAGGQVTPVTRPGVTRGAGLGGGPRDTPAKETDQEIDT